MVLINDNAGFSRRVIVRLPGVRGAATLERMQAPAVTSTSGVSLAGQGFGPTTRSGALAGHVSTAPLPSARRYAVVLPAASAALITTRPR